ncbi:MAG TPA: LysR family transcriptional regulator [Steroidobacteraceae bacterium]|jgi:molybdate transport system regulatory protein|nr:LysR family transcriptional regulator [Steroidobacteraceae bacterium]
MKKNSRRKMPGDWPRVRIRIDFSSACAVGPGKIALLEAIARVGSLSVAARDLGMSYRRGWMLLSDLNNSFDRPVVTTAVGGLRGGGAQVTEFGQALVRGFRGLELAARKLADRHMSIVRLTPGRRATTRTRRLSRKSRA